jgi:flagellar biosynthesis protein FlhF
MKIKKFLAPNMPEAMKQIRLELGDQAVILNSKVIQRKGFLGFMKKRNLEVIAAVDPEPGKPRQREITPAKIEYEKAKEIRTDSRVEPAEANKKQAARETESLHRELAELKRAVLEISGFSSAVFQKYPLKIQKFLSRCTEQELDKAFVLSIGECLLEQWKAHGKEPSEGDVLDWGKAVIRKKLSRFACGEIQSKYVNLIGPTGVGKTTTLAKMAAGAVLDKKEKIAFITTDTYRIAAVEQLKTYANLLNVPFEVIYKLSDFHKAIEKFAGFDRIYIDTAGRNYREIQYIRELKGLIDFNENMETFLALSMTMKEKDMAAVMEKYGTGCAYVTNGQDVPDDIIEASPDTFIQYLFGENGNERPS